MLSLMSRCCLRLATPRDVCAHPGERRGVFARASGRLSARPPQAWFVLHGTSAASHTSHSPSSVRGVGVAAPQGCRWRMRLEAGTGGAGVSLAKGSWKIGACGARRWYPEPLNPEPRILKP